MTYIKYPGIIREKLSVYCNFGDPKRLSMNLVRYAFLTTILSLAFSTIGYAQLVVGFDTLYGNEWINYDQPYYKIKIGADGIYRITYADLVGAGVPASGVDIANLQLFWMGKEQTLHTSKPSGTLTAGDYIEFFGQQNRSQLDRFLFRDPDREMLNPEYGLTTDTSAYFLTWTDTPSSARYEVLAAELPQNLPAKRDWYMHHEKLVLSQAPIKGNFNSKDVRFSTYGEGEGFGSSAINKHSFELGTSQVSTSGPAPTLRLRMTGTVTDHNVSLDWNSRALDNIVFEARNGKGGGVLIDSLIQLAPEDLQQINTLSAHGNNDKERISFSVLDLQYARNFSFNDMPFIRMNLEDARDGLYLEMAGLNQASTIIYDISSNSKVNTTQDGDILKMYIPPGPNGRQIVIQNTPLAPKPMIVPVVFDNLTQSDANYIIISNQKLSSNSDGEDLVAQYAQYRSSNAGGNYRTKIVDIDQLINQYAYGVHMHPYSIKNFTNYIYKSWADPQFLFMIGKGLEYSLIRKTAPDYHFLPVYGRAGSDNLLTSRSLSSTPLIPVGRLAVRNAEEISIYLDKVKIMQDHLANAPQTIEGRGWLKRVLHLSAGENLSEQTFIRNNMDNMANAIVGPKFGAEVSTTQKQAGADIIDNQIGEKTLDLINSGIILKSYFGHGGITTTELQRYEDPFFLNNQDKYPVMLALGCHTGNIFTHQISLSESNVLTPDKGGMAYIATSALGFLAALDDYAYDFYQKFGDDLFGETIGECVKAAIEIHDAKTSLDIKTFVQQLIYHGDPAIRMSPRAQKPDLLIDYSTVRTEPAQIDVQLDSFALLFDIVNLGRIVSDSFNIKVDHKLPDGQVSDLGRHRVTVENGRVETRLILPLIKSQNTIGANTLFVELDIENEIDESPAEAEVNNELVSPDLKKGFEFVIFDSNIRPLFPPKYGITNKQDLKLIASATNPLAPKSNYKIELDTTTEFNSPYLETITLTDQFPLLKWDPNSTFQDGVVYYWRIINTTEENQVWMSSSFLFSNEIESGWNQSHYFQFLQNDLSRINLDTNRQFTFKNTTNDFILKNKADINVATGANGLVNNSRWSDFFRWQVKQGIGFILLDPTNEYGFQFNQQPGEFGSVSPDATIASFPFQTTTQEDRQKIVNFLDKEVPEGTSIIAYTMQSQPNLNLGIPEWDSDSIGGQSLFSLFEELGATKFELLRDGARPYIIRFIKGKEVLEELIAPDSVSSVLLTTSIPIQSTKGSLLTNEIGPAKKWNELRWAVDNSEADDSIYINLLAVDPHSDEPVFLQSAPEYSLSLSDLTPETILKLEYEVVDTTNKTPPQLDFLRILYDGLPDVTFNQMGLAILDQDSLEIGNVVFNANFVVENLTEYPMDSLLVKFSISDPTGTKVLFRRYKNLSAFESLVIKESIPTEITGDIDFRIELNPDQDQAEQYHENNFLVKKFKVQSDLSNPILEVTFDGKTIFNEDIVSPAPFIKISLDDENENLLISDTSTFRILVTDPSGKTTSILTGDENVNFIPGIAPDNIACIEWTPTFTEDGIHHLSVQGKDKSGNRAGKTAYEVRFNVILESTISSITNYPNPFTTSTRFLYTLTGTNLPQQYKISIFSPSGTVVKELTEFDLGPLEIGQNLTSLAWDGTDQFGDQLANGTYLYKMKIQDDSNEMKHRATKLDNYMQRGYGKLVIIR